MKRIKLSLLKDKALYKSRDTRVYLKGVSHNETVSWS